MFSFQRVVFIFQRFFIFSKGGFFFGEFVFFFSNGVVSFSDFPFFFKRLITQSFNVGVSYVRPEFKIQNLATWQWLPFDPNSMGHMLFELCTIVFLAVDLTLIPLVLAWDIPLTDVWIAFNLFSVLFWTADIGISFSTSFTIDGEVLAGVSTPEIFFWRSTSFQVFFWCRVQGVYYYFNKKGVFFF